MEATTGFEVLAITLGNERVVDTYFELETAFAGCRQLWAGRKPGQPVYVVRDCQTEQRYSFNDIKELTAAAQVAA